jgi:hypothetical protein
MQNPASGLRKVVFVESRQGHLCLGQDVVYFCGHCMALTFAVWTLTEVVVTLKDGEPQSLPLSSESTLAQAFITPRHQGFSSKVAQSSLVGGITSPRRNPTALLVNRSLATVILPTAPVRLNSGLIVPSFMCFPFV